MTFWICKTENMGRGKECYHVVDHERSVAAKPPFMSKDGTFGEFNSVTHYFNSRRYAIAVLKRSCPKVRLKNVHPNMNYVEIWSD